MNRTTSILLLALAAVLEASGDALMRNGLHAASPVLRTAWFVIGAVVLFAYGWTVNAPPWDFGKLLGLYVVFFFIAAQLISWFAFGQPPGKAVLFGGLLIVSGGFVIAASTSN
jgi:small multidrug resistance family-3 protein